VRDLATANGCTSVGLQVVAHNRAMILYLKKGFIVTGAIKMRWLMRFFRSNAWWTWNCGLPRQKWKPCRL